MPACDGASCSISSQMSSTDSRPRSAPRRRASSAAIIQSARAVPGGVTFWPSTLTRPSMLVVVPPTSAKPAAGSTTSACGRRLGEEGVDGDDRAGAGEARRGQVAVGEVGERVGAEQHQRVDPAVGRGLRGCRWRRGPARPAPCRHAVGEPVAAVVERDPARAAARARGPCRGRRGRWPGAAPAGSGRRARRRAATAAAATTAVAGLGQRRPAEHDGERRRSRAARAPGPRARRRRRRRRRPSPTSASSALDGLAGAVAQRRRGVARSRPVASGDSSTTLTPSVDDGVAQPQVQDRQLLLEVGAEQEHRAAGARTPRRSSPAAGRARPRPAGRRRAGVDVVGADHALGQLRPGVGGLVGEAGAAEDGDAAGPPRSSAVEQRRGRRAERLGPAGLGQLVAGVAARAARRGGRRLLTASKSNRPLSHSQPQLTGSMSTPW